MENMCKQASPPQQIASRISRIAAPDPTSKHVCNLCSVSTGLCPPLYTWPSRSNAVICRNPHFYTYPQQQSPLRYPKLIPVPICFRARSIYHLTWKLNARTHTASRAPQREVFSFFFFLNIYLLFIMYTIVYLCVCRRPEGGTRPYYRWL